MGCFNDNPAAINTLKETNKELARIRQCLQDMVKILKEMNEASKRFEDDLK